MLVGNAVVDVKCSYTCLHQGGKKGKKNKGVGAGEVPKAESVGLKREK